MEPNQIKQTPGRVLVAFAILASLVAVFTVVDSRRRGAQEGVDLPTGLGDREWFAFGRFEPAEPVLSFGGEALYRQRSEPVDRMDFFMFKAGRDDDDQGFIYRYWNYKRDMKGAEGEYFAKVGEGSYMELRGEPRPAEAGDGDGEVQPE